MAPRPTIQDMVKAAQAGSLSRARVDEEARRQMENITGEKTASAQEQEMSVPTQYIDKLAGALEFLATEFGKEASSAAHISETTQMPGKGPGALELSQATASTMLPDHKGQGHHQPPHKPGVEKVRPSDAAANALQTNEAHATSGHTPQKVASNLLESNLARLGIKKVASENCEKCGKPKTACECKDEKKASALLEGNLSRLGVKQAEDAINPAHISAGPAVPPETSASGQPGGAPAGGQPGPGTQMVDSNQAATNYTKGQAKAGPKADMKKWFSEPALTSQTDSTLRAAFDSTPQAGTKFGSAGSVKVASARALLETLLEEQNNPVA